MITHTKRNELFAVLVALLIVTILFMNGYAYAHTNVDINSSLNINSKNTSTSKNTIKINGETIVDDETNDGNVKSNIEVKLENGKGTVKYTEGEDEKIIQVTPKDNNSTNETSVNEDDNENKTEKNELENKEKEKDTKPHDLIEEMMKTLDRFFAKLSDLFN